MIEATLRSDFRRFFGPVPPVLAVGAALLVGIGALAILGARDFGRVDVVAISRRGLVVAAVTATVLAIAAAVADSTIGFADDINVPWPRALVFYPVVAVVAEVVFHLVPAAVLSIAFPSSLDGPRLGVGGAVCLLVIAATETVYQTAATWSGNGRSALVLFVAVHLLVLGLTQAVVLWRFGAIAMLAFRLVYYAEWHVIWEQLRYAARR